MKVYQQAIEKVWRSLDKNYNDKFANLIAAIQTKGQEIKTRAEIGFQARVSDMHSDVQAIHCGMHGLAEIIGNEGKARAEAEQSYQRQIEQLEIDKMNQRNELLSRGKATLNHCRSLANPEKTNQRILSTKIWSHCLRIFLLR